MKKIYLAGGCFWGVEHYFSLIKGINKTRVGYANSNLINPSYVDVCTGLSNASEAVEIIYDENIIDLKTILKYYLEIIDPTSLNKQGNDIGLQYRTGIYYIDNNDIKTIDDFIKDLKLKYSKDIMIEVMALENFYEAEEYHQDYLYKNPDGYCHIPKFKFDEIKLKNIDL